MSIESTRLPVNVGSCRMWVILTMNLIAVVCSKFGVDPGQYNYLKTSLDMECGTSSDDTTSNARIINGNPAEITYPWMAYVYRRARLIPKYQMPKFGLTHDFVPSAGVIISNTAILTCGHCICLGAEFKSSKAEDSRT